MSGFSGLVAAIAIALMVLSSLTAVIDVTNRSVVLVSEAVEHLLKQYSEAKVSGVTLSREGKNTVLLFNVENTGIIPVSVCSFPKIDLMVVAKSDEAIVALRLNYSKSPSVGSWTVRRVLSVNGGSEVINVVSIATGTGLWDPGEKLEVKAILPGLFKSVHLVFVLPDGTQATYG